jgi:hypothetical protein
MILQEAALKARYDLICLHMFIAVNTFNDASICFFLSIYPHKLFSRFIYLVLHRGNKTQQQVLPISFQQNHKLPKRKKIVLLTFDWLKSSPKKPSFKLGILSNNCCVFSFFFFFFSGTILTTLMDNIQSFLPYLVAAAAAAGSAYFFLNKKSKKRIFLFVCFFTHLSIS